VSLLRCVNQTPSTGCHARRSTIALVIALSLLATAGMQALVQKERHRLVKPASVSASLNSLNSFSLSLLLGGLRGPLVMFLWTSSESQKQERNLDDFDSKIEMIRLLQPEFDTVHMFQIWNKAYNASNMMASNSNKYITILDAIRYAQDINAERPNDINIMTTLASVYFEKLGNSQEKEYYARRVRADSFAPVRVTVPLAMVGDLDAALCKAGYPESVPRVMRDQAAGTASLLMDKTAYDALRMLLHGPSVRYASDMDAAELKNSVSKAIRLAPVLDLHGNILPEMLKPDTNLHRPANVSEGGQWNTGAPLQYLEKYQRAADVENRPAFPYGISPLALGYNYYKQAQILQRNTGQRHLQLGPAILDHQPAICLKMWAEHELEWAHRRELRGWGGTEAQDLSVSQISAMPAVASASIPYDKAFTDPAAIEEAIYSETLAASLAGDAFDEYTRHLREYGLGFNNFLSHRDMVTATRSLALADIAYLSLAKASQAYSPAMPQQRNALQDHARTLYQKAIDAYEIVILRYYIDDVTASMILPQGMLRTNIGDETHSIASPELADLLHRARKAIAQLAGQGVRHYDPAEDRVLFERWLRRGTDRMAILSVGH